MVINKQGGFTLIELLLSIGLSAFMLSGLYVLFATHSKTYKSQQTIIQAKESAQVVMNILRRRIRQTGSLGCISWFSASNIFNKASSLPEHLPKNMQQIIYNYHANKNNWSPPLPSYLKNRVRENTDVLMVHLAHDPSTHLAQPMINLQSSLIIASDLDLKIGDALIIADCSQADIFKISNISRSGNYWIISHQSPYNSSNQLSKAYNTTAEISVLKSAAFYVGDTKRYNPNGDKIYSLYQYIGEHQELVEGITDLKVEFSVDTNADGSADTMISYVTEHFKGIIRSIALTLETYEAQKWHASIALRN